MKVVESMAINNVDINSFKQQLKGDGIQLVLILGKLFIKHVIPKPLFKINGGSTQIWCLYKSILSKRNEKFYSWSFLDS